MVLGLFLVFACACFDQFKLIQTKNVFALAQGRAVIHLGRHRHGRQLSRPFKNHGNWNQDLLARSH